MLFLIQEEKTEEEIGVKIPLIIIVSKDIYHGLRATNPLN